MHMKQLNKLEFEMKKDFFDKILSRTVEFPNICSINIPKMPKLALWEKAIDFQEFIRNPELIPTKHYQLLPSTNK